MAKPFKLEPRQSINSNDDTGYFCNWTNVHRIYSIEDNYPLLQMNIHSLKQFVYFARFEYLSFAHRKSFKFLIKFFPIENEWVKTTFPNNSLSSGPEIAFYQVDKFEVFSVDSRGILQCLEKYCLHTKKNEWKTNAANKKPKQMPGNFKSWYNRTIAITETGRFFNDGYRIRQISTINRMRWRWR